MNYSVHPHAEKELEDVENYYDGINEDLGDRFRAEIEMALSRIIKFPNAWQPLTKKVRRRRLIDFPYGIVYRVKPSEIKNLGGDAPSPRTGLLGIQTVT